MAATGFLAGNDELLLKPIWRTSYKHPFPFLPYDEAAAAWHGRERARLEDLGRPAPYVDGQIAAIAHTSGLTVVTINTRDFTRFKDVQIENWFMPSSR